MTDWAAVASRCHERIAEIERKQKAFESSWAVWTKRSSPGDRGSSERAFALSTRRTPLRSKTT